MDMALKNKIIFISFFYLVFVSCQKDSVPVSVVEGDKSIVCQVSVMGANDTKSLEVGLDSLKKYGFRMDAWLEAQNRDRRSDLWPQLNENPHYIKDANITFIGGEWKSSVDTVFWTNQIWTNFWAQYPYSPAGRGNLTLAGISDEQQKTPWFTYDMSSYSYPKDTLCNPAKETRDLLVAYSRVKYDVDAKTFQPSEGLDFTFSHVLSAVTFDVYTQFTKYKVDTIMISGIHVKGTCNLTVLPLQGVGERDSVSVSWNVTDTPSNDRAICQDFQKMEPDNYIFWVPQKLPLDAMLKIHVYLVPGGGGDIKNERWYTTQIGGNWKPGYIYQYILTHEPDLDSVAVTVNGGYEIRPGIWN